MPGAPILSTVPDVRVRRLNAAPLRGERPYVLYWMTAARRLEWNFGLQRAVERCREVGAGLVVLEALRAAYPWASARHHRFALDGMADHARRLEGGRVRYHPYVEPADGAGKGLLEALGARAALVVADDFPAFFIPRMLEAAAGRLDVRLEAVDSSGLLPLATVDRDHRTARSFRRFLQGALPAHLERPPAEHPLRGNPLPGPPTLPAGVGERWPRASDALLEGEVEPPGLGGPGPEVPPVRYRGGARAARAALEGFLDDVLPRYADDARHPDDDATSGLSPWLHWGHLSAHEVFRRVADREGWSPARLAPEADGVREGWWGMSEGAEAFLEQLVTWRELGYAFCRRTPDHDRFEVLPDWARETLENHADDPRPRLYGLRELARAGTDDPVWNAAQRQLRDEGRIHSYLRMLWGKRILTWTPTPRRALEVMVELNNRYAADGRDPNSYAGILWCLGLFDRGWPEREIFGKVRCMTSGSARRKLRLERYLARWGPGGAGADPSGDD